VENLGDEPYNGVYIGVKGKLEAATGDPKGSPVTSEQLAEILAEHPGATAKP
jgi:hypothetical protein